MDNRIYLLLLNPAIALVLASTFFVLWRYQRHAYLAALVFAYAASAGGFLLQAFTLPIGFVATKFLANLLFSLAAFCIAGAVIGRNGRPPPYFALGLLCVGGLAAWTWFMAVEPDLNWRIYAISFAFGGVSLVVAAELRALPQKDPADRILLVLALLSALNFFARTLVALKIHGTFETYDGFYESLYWTTLLLSHAVLSLLIALSLLTSAALEALKQLRKESQIDPLSGLLNRRGFEAAACEAIARSIGQGLPAALVLADLDHFKAVNDTYGHDAGDKAIVAFAERIAAAAGKSGIAGRIGGEEFAILLTAADLSAARLFAEGVRASFSNNVIAGAPSAARLTASFGVAALSGNEGLSALLRRADEALYHAKKSGRDRVRLSYQRAPDILAASLPPA